GGHPACRRHGRPLLRRRAPHAAAPAGVEARAGCGAVEFAAPIWWLFGHGTSKGEKTLDQCSPPFPPRGRPPMTRAWWNKAATDLLRTVANSKFLAAVKDPGSSGADYAAKATGRRFIGSNGFDKKGAPGATS